MLKLILFSLLVSLAVGALLPLLFISIEEMGVFFYRLMSGILAMILLMAIWAHPFHDLENLMPLQVFGFSNQAALPLIAVCCLALIIGIFTIRWIGKLYLVLAFAVGLVAITWIAMVYPVSSGLPQPAGWTKAASLLGSTFLLGTVSTAMVTGHWYLVNHKLTIRPLKMATILFLAAAVVRIVFVAALVAMLIFSSDRGLGQTAQSLLGFSGGGLIFWVRVIVGLVGPIVFGWMIYQTVKIRSTQSATGILYATIVFVFIGEAFSKFLWFFTGIPV